jgi:hypothetical protein
MIQLFRISIRISHQAHQGHIDHKTHKTCQTHETHARVGFNLVNHLLGRTHPKPSLLPESSGIDKFAAHFLTFSGFTNQ